MGRLLLLMLVVTAAPEAFAADLLPLSAFANAPEFSHPRISPDGTKIVYLDRSTAKFFVAVLDLTTGVRNAAMLGDVKDFLVKDCWFKNNTRLLCRYAGTEFRDGQAITVSRLVALNSDGTEQQVLVQNGRAGSAQFQDGIIDPLRDDPRNVLIQLDDDNNVLTSVFKLDVYSGKLTRIQADKFRILRWLTDRDGVVRFGYGYKETQSLYIARDSESAPWRTLLRFRIFNNDSFSVYGFGAQPNKLIVSAPKNGRDAVWEMDLGDQTDKQLLFSHSQVDVDFPVNWPSDGHIVGFAYVTDKPQLELFDDRARSVQAAIDVAFPGATNRVISASRDNKQLIISSQRDVQPTNYFLLDATTGKLARLSRNAPLLTDESLSVMNPVVITAADGRAIPGYLTVPRGHDPRNLPAVVLPHGGPYARNSWGYDELVQMLASRCYAVLQVNYRGSTGYGDAWFRAGFQHWGTAMHEDITAGTRWLVSQGIADPKRICLVGWAFGGYAALIGGIKERALYRCIASISGISDMKELAWERRGFYGGRKITELATGTEERDENSPRRRAAELKLPVLLVHGAWDSVVNVEQSRAMASALAHSGNPAKLVIIKKGDHSLTGPELRLTLYQNLEQFLAAHLSAH